jgi:hypothetical protein
MNYLSFEMLYNQDSVNLDEHTRLNDVKMSVKSACKDLSHNLSRMYNVACIITNKIATRKRMLLTSYSGSLICDLK